MWVAFDTMRGAVPRLCMEASKVLLRSLLDHDEWEKLVKGNAAGLACSCYVVTPALTTLIMQATWGGCVRQELRTRLIRFRGVSQEFMVIFSCQQQHLHTYIVHSG